MYKHEQQRKQQRFSRRQETKQVAKEQVAKAPPLNYLIFFVFITSNVKLSI